MSRLNVCMAAAVRARDIDLVLITGAGASRAFGVNDTQLPLMAEWSEFLVRRLGQKDPAYLQATGLRSGLTSEEFEAQLGQFLRSVDAFNQIEPLLAPIASMPSSQPSFQSTGQWTSWHFNARFHLGQITGTIHESLYALFAAPAVDIGAAQQAYGSLLHQLGVGPTARWVYATTNYDTIGEDVIAAEGGLPDVGDIQASPFTAERAIRVDRLLDGMPRYVPVLHLHGRVGWLRRTNGTAYSTPSEQYNNDFGTPIVMLPDVEKDYETDPIVSTLWQQFHEALERAKRVLVLGHSLHDRALMKALAERVEPLTRLAVTVLSAPQNGMAADGPEAADVADRVRQQLPGATVLPLRFESGLSVPSTTRDWLSAVDLLPH